MKCSEDIWAFRDRLRRELGVALKSRQPETVSVLRTILAAIDNAESVRPQVESPRADGGIIAYSSLGVGSTEAPRRQLTMSDVHDVIRGLRDECETHAEQYRSMRQYDAADRHQRQAAILRNYLSA